MVTLSNDIDCCMQEPDYCKGTENISRSDSHMEESILLQKNKEGASDSYVESSMSTSER